MGKRFGSGVSEEGAEKAGVASWIDGCSRQMTLCGPAATDTVLGGREGGRSKAARWRCQVRWRSNESGE